MRKPRSIFWKLSLLFLVVLIASLIGHGLLVVVPAARVLGGYYQDSLVREASLAATMLGPLVPPQEHGEEIREVLEATFRPAPNLALVLFDSEGTVHASLRAPRHPPLTRELLQELVRHTGASSSYRRPLRRRVPPLTLHRVGGEASPFFVAALPERSGKALVHETYPGLQIRTILLLFLGAAAAGMWGLRLFSDRLSRLREGMEMLSQGDLTIRLDPGSDDEIGTLIASFNQTAEKLQDAETELRAQDQARREMLADVSHELRTPLTTIRGHLELLLEDREQLASSQARSVTILDDETRALSQRIEDLLTLSRQASGQLPLNRAETDLGALVEDLVERFQDLCRERGIELSIQRPAESLLLEVDPDRIHQVLRNLLENALHNLASGDRLEVRLSAEPELAILEVKDEGPGIPPEDIPHLFERFRRGKGSRGAGTGLGLAIARGLVEQHGGRCSVTSELGSGSCFRVELPRAPLPPDC